MNNIRKLFSCGIIPNGTQQKTLYLFSNVVRNSSTNSMRVPSGNSMRKINGSIGVAGYSMLAVPLATFGLGCWQVQRRKWKLELISELNAKTNSPPIELPFDLEELDNLEYRRIKVVGEFDHSKEVYIQSRSLLTSGDATGGGLISAGIQSGTLVITPFHVKDRDLSILVNRGWVPRKHADPRTRKDGQVSGEMTIVGVVRHSEARAPFVPQNKQGNNFYYYRDIDAMAEMCGTAPIFVDADSDSTVENGPIGGQTRVSLRNEHISYIITWYALCAATTFLWYKKYIKRKAIM